ncbi:glycoside hydrolase family 6 protein [Dactylosporangium sp. AC04546]|nr:glycoside hydrolase family 6 protein [Dactylosporangium sp. AC04546]WVK85781.1 glycoside hydrolase family 6 protein [Dactylosporangium sp. AC04546]
MRRKLAIVSIAAIAATGGAIAVTSPAFAATGCSAKYTISSSWPGGFGANVEFTNLGDPLTSWTLGWDFGNSSQKIQQMWQAVPTQTGLHLDAKNESYNGTVATGGKVQFGFNGAWSGSNPVPTAFTLNGVVCDGGSSPTNQAPTVSLTSPAANASFTAPATVNIAANAADADGTIAKVEFYQGTTLLGTDTSAPYSYSWTNVAAGSYSITARAYDNGGLSTNSGIVPITVTNGGGNGSPTVSLTSPSTGSSYTAPATVSLAATASDSDGTVTKVDFYNGSTLLGTDTTSPYTYTWSNVAAGSYTLTARATDNSGNTTTSAASAITVTGGGTTPNHADNPYVGARGYVNEDWASKARAEGGTAVAGVSTGVWIDRIAAIAGSSSAKGVRAHLDAALTQAAAGSGPLTIQFVIYNLPNRDCSALASNGELKIAQDGLNRYKTEYIDPIAAILSDPKYASLRIVTIIEIDSLPNLVTNLNVAACQEAQSTGAYVQGIQYALNKLHAIGNVYTYIDAGHHGWLGWDTNFNPSAELFASTVQATTAGFASVDGFITNTANYSALSEPYFTVNTTVNGQSVRQSKWVDWNFYVDELTFAQAFRNKLVSLGFNSNIGMLIDTSRNGWGGSARPTAASTSTDVNTFVNQSRVDRRIHAGNWCNQSGAGLGERPRATPQPGIDAYVWIKPPGESDGSSSLIPNDEGKGFDRMCDPTYTGNVRNGNSLTGALPNAPVSGQWFGAQFRELMANAYPAL